MSKLSDLVPGSILAWHFTTLEGTTEYLKRPEQAGKTYRVKPPIILCEHGLHGCIKPLDALQYASGPLVRRVVLSGEIAQDSDKCAASRRKLLWQADATNTLYEFACQVAEEALLRERAAGREPDARSWNAIETKRKWLLRESTDDELQAAREAARAAARIATWAAASKAAWAAAREAAWEAAREAAWEAAREAAWAAAWAAAMEAAREAAWAAAWAAAKEAAREAANTRLETMLLALEPTQ